MRTPARRQLPYHYREMLAVIWKKCGDAEFIYNYISKDFPGGPGNITRMSNQGYILDCGRVMKTGSTSTKKWKLAADIAFICKRDLGPCPKTAATESAQAIRDYEAHILDITIYSRRVPETIQHMNDRLAIARIASVFGTRPWITHEIKEALSIKIYYNRVKGWQDAGYIIHRGVVKSGDHHNANLWSISPAYLTQLEATA